MLTLKKAKTVVWQTVKREIRQIIITLYCVVSNEYKNQSKLSIFYSMDMQPNLTSSQNFILKLI
jgi:hypothetical protein